MCVVNQPPSEKKFVYILSHIIKAVAWKLFPSFDNDR